MAQQQSDGLVIERSQVRAPTGEAGESSFAWSMFCADLFRYWFHPRVTAAAHKRSRPFCQNNVLVSARLQLNTQAPYVGSFEFVEVQNNYNNYHHSGEKIPNRAVRRTSVFPQQYIDILVLYRLETLGKAFRGYSYIACCFPRSNLSSPDLFRSKRAYVSSRSGLIPS